MLWSSLLTGRWELKVYVHLCGGSFVRTQELKVDADVRGLVRCGNLEVDGSCSSSVSA